MGHSAIPADVFGNHSCGWGGPQYLRGGGGGQGAGNSLPCTGQPCNRASPAPDANSPKAEKPAVRAPGLPSPASVAFRDYRAAPGIASPAGVSVSVKSRKLTLLGDHEQALPWEAGP